MKVFSGDPQLGLELTSLVQAFAAKNGLELPPPKLYDNPEIIRLVGQTASCDHKGTVLVNAKFFEAALDAERKGLPGATELIADVLKDFSQSAPVTTAPHVEDDSDSIGYTEVSNQLLREFGVDGIAMAIGMNLPISPAVLKELGLENNVPAGQPLESNGPGMALG